MPRMRRGNTLQGLSLEQDAYSPDQATTYEQRSSGIGGSNGLVLGPGAVDTSHIAAGAVSPDKMAVNHQANYNYTTDYSFTGDTNWHSVLTKGILVPAHFNMCIFSFGTVQWQCDNVGAVADFSLSIGDGTTTYDLNRYFSAYNPAANVNNFTAFASGDNIKFSLPLLNLDATYFAPNNLSVGIWVRLKNAAYTVTIKSSLGMDSLSLFTVGDSTDGWNPPS